MRDLRPENGMWREMKECVDGGFQPFLYASWSLLSL
jgi:hypothetical protein